MASTYEVGDRVVVNIDVVTKIYPYTTISRPFAATIITYDEEETEAGTSYVYRLSVDGLGNTYKATEVNGQLQIGG